MCGFGSPGGLKKFPARLRATGGDWYSFQIAIVASRLDLINCDIAPSAKIIGPVNQHQYIPDCWNLLGSTSLVRGGCLLKPCKHRGCM